MRSCFANSESHWSVRFGPVTGCAWEDSPPHDAFPLGSGLQACWRPITSLQNSESVSPKCSPQLDSGKSWGRATLTRVTTTHPSCLARWFQRMNDPGKIQAWIKGPSWVTSVVKTPRRHLAAVRAGTSVPWHILDEDDRMTELNRSCCHDLEVRFSVTVNYPNDGEIRKLPRMHVLDGATCCSCDFCRPYQSWHGRLCIRAAGSSPCGHLVSLDAPSEYAPVFG